MKTLIACVAILAALLGAGAWSAYHLHVARAASTT